MTSNVVLRLNVIIDPLLEKLQCYLSKFKAEGELCHQATTVIAC